jgi:hypothetical protein
MTQEEFAKLKEVTPNFFNITDSNISDKARTISKVLQNYVGILIDEIKQLKMLKSLQTKLYGELYKKYNEKYTVELDSKHEIESYIFAEDKYYDQQLLINEQETIVKYLEETIDNFKKLSFNIKNWIDIKKYFEGN